MMSKGSCIEDPHHLRVTVTCQTNQVSGEQNADYLLFLKKIISSNFAGIMINYTGPY